ncbi:unnamed protein product [Coccothraustes coccothraustes]
MQALWHAEDANLGLSRAKRLVAGGFWQEPRFGEDRRNAQCATKPLLCLRELQSAAAAETHTEEANLELSGAKRPVAGGFWQEPRFGEHCYRHNAQCAKKPLLCLREPQSAAAAETRRTKAHYTGIRCAALKLIRDGTFPVAYLFN